MTDTNDLRNAAICIHIATDKTVAADIASKLMWAAAEIERLQAALAEERRLVMLAMAIIFILTVGLFAVAHVVG